MTDVSNTAAVAATAAEKAAAAMDKAAGVAQSAMDKAGEIAAKAPQTAADVIHKASESIPPGLLDKMGDGMLKMFDAAGQVLKQYGPDAAQLALGYVRMTGLVTIVEGLFMLGLAGALAAAIRPIWFPKRDKKDRDIILRRSLVDTWEQGIDDKRSYGGTGKFCCTVGTIVLAIATIIVGIEGLSHVADLWAWVKIVYPEAGIVHDVYNGLILKK